MPTEEPAPRLYIDEDWKQQAQAEKEALARGAAQSAGAAASAPHEPAAAETAAAPSEDRPPLPSPSLPLLVTMFATEAMVALGQVPSPLTGMADLDLDAARHTIDMLALIEDKTEGNRTPDETAMLRHVLHDLRMAFVAFRERK